MFWNLQHDRVFLHNVKTSLFLRKYLVITDHVTVIGLEHPDVEEALESTKGEGTEKINTVDANQHGGSTVPKPSTKGSKNFFIS